MAYICEYFEKKAQDGIALVWHEFNEFVDTKGEVFTEVSETDLARFVLQGLVLDWQD